VEAAVSYLNDFGGGEDGARHDDKQVMFHRLGDDSLRGKGGLQLTSLDHSMKDL
jgi:hypothetical protein